VNPAGEPPGSPPTLTGVPVLSLRHAAKSFGAVRAVVDGTVELYGGEAHALLGENGAGKSTMVKMLAGVHQPDAGQILIDEQPVTLNGPAAAQAAGIAVIYQEPALFPDLSVAENIFMGRQPLRAGRRIDRKLLREQSAELFARLGVPLDPDRVCRGLSIADQQLVEIAKALSLDARVIVMDEPTAALSATEVGRLFDVVRTLCESGAAVLFITHRLEEVFEICQRATVMRDGAHVLTTMVADVSADDLIRAMVGREMPTRERRGAAWTDEQGSEAEERGGKAAPKAPLPAGGSGGSSPRASTVLAVQRLTREGVFIDISFEVKAGEIVALAGLVGAGRSEVARAIFGIDRYDAGGVLIGGQPLRKASPAAAMVAGLGYVPEDRRQQGLVMEMSIQQNVGLASLHRLQRHGLIRSAAEQTFATDWAQRLSLKYARLTDPVSRLSGGNQQKVVLAKWLGRQPKVLIVDEPTRGIDIGTKAEVHRLLVQLASTGVAVLMISSELPEVLAIGDRILVMREGRLTAEFGYADASEESIMAAATGQFEAQAVPYGLGGTTPRNPPEERRV
jgi:rhamnose transport system ATP-binding protein